MTKVSRGSSCANASAPSVRNIQASPCRAPSVNRLGAALAVTARLLLCLPRCPASPGSGAAVTVRLPVTVAASEPVEAEAQIIPLNRTA